MSSLENKDVGSLPLMPRGAEPELATASHLEDWADSLKARSAFPELIRRLLAGTSGVSEIAVRANEGVDAPGWDGRANSTGSAFLPHGKLRFEMGTGRDPKRKAEQDYAKRVGELPEQTDETFVFLTPRNWPGASEWASEKAAEGHFRDVKAYDAHHLEGWLQSSPDAHYWLSEAIGMEPRNVQSLMGWWAEFASRTEPELPPNFHLAGRQPQAQQLLSRLSTTVALGGRQTTVQASWTDEALAFVYAALKQDAELLERAVIVKSASVWQRVLLSGRPLVLIPTFTDSLNLADAEQHGHHVVLLADSTDNIRRGADQVVLGSVGFSEAYEVLSEVFPSHRNVHEFVSLARRSVSALFRELDRDPRRSRPAWATSTETVRIVAPLILLGSWADADDEGDVTVVERLTERSWAEVERQLLSLANQPDPPFVKVGNRWQLTAPVEAAQLLVSQLTSADRKLWAEIVVNVLLAKNPLSALSLEERIAASFKGVRAPYTDVLIRGIANSLSLIAVNAAPIETDVQLIVHRLLQQANSDKTAEAWLTLAPILPELAEAAPDVFLDAVDQNLRRDSPTLREIFQDTEGGILDASSPHTSLLWALERLGWSREHFARTMSVLADLAEVDPGGRLTNRPMNSMANMTLGWIRQSGADTDAKLAAIRRLLKGAPSQTGWKLLTEVWPFQQTTATPPHSPKYRDWMPANQEVMVTDYHRFAKTIFELAIEAAGASPTRWSDLFDRLFGLPSEFRPALFDAVHLLNIEEEWSADEKYVLWRKLSESVAHHRAYPEAEWAWTSEELEPLQALIDRLEPTQDIRRFVPLFDGAATRSRYRLEDREQLIEDQLRALDEVLLMGPVELSVLIDQVPHPHLIGSLLARTEKAPEREILLWLQSDNTKLRQVAGAFIASKVWAVSPDWLMGVLQDSEITNEATVDLIMAQAPVTRDFWTLVATLGPAYEEVYWRQVHSYQVPDEQRLEAIDRLLSFGRIWVAAEVLAEMLKGADGAYLELVVSVLDQLIVSKDRTDDHTMSVYYVGLLLDYLAEHSSDRNLVAKYEFAFHNFVGREWPPMALYQSLVDNAAEFVELVKIRFRPDDSFDSDSAERSTSNAALVRIAHDLLWNWPILPGQRDDGSIDAQHLRTWVLSARELLSQSGHSRIGEDQIGQVLSASPVDEEGIWPVEPVRNLIEELRSDSFDNALRVGHTNRRGMTTRSMLEGGAQEWALVDRYTGMAEKAADEWPRTARMLRKVAEFYTAAAREEDAAVDSIV